MLKGYLPFGISDVDMLFSTNSLPECGVGRIVVVGQG